MFSSFGQGPTMEEELRIFPSLKALWRIAPCLAWYFARKLPIEEDLGISSSFQACIERRARNFAIPEHIWRLEHELSIEKELGIFPSPWAYVTFRISRTGSL